MNVEVYCNLTYKLNLNYKSASPGPLGQASRRGVSNQPTNDRYDRSLGRGVLPPTLPCKGNPPLKTRVDDLKGRPEWSNPDLTEE